MQLEVDMGRLDKDSDHFTQIRGQLLSLVIFVLFDIVFDLSKHIELHFELRVLTSN